MSSTERAGGCLLPLLVLVWAACVVGFGVSLMVENRAASCPLPHQADNSTTGNREWQWWPPGSACIRPDDLDVASAPREWDRPQPWRGAVVIFLVASGLGLVYAFRRSEHAYESQWEGRPVQQTGP